MAMSKFRLIISTIIVLILLTTSFSGCGTADKKPFWNVTNGNFHTNDVKLAQAEIPFTIVLPKYLPGDLGLDYLYQISGPVRKEGSTVTHIEIMFRKGDKEIDIREENKIVEWMPSEELNPVYTNIAGLQVLRENSHIFTDSGTVEGRLFLWNQNEVNISVGVYAITKDEATKIVESMISQLE